MIQYFQETMQVLQNTINSLDTNAFSRLVTECEIVLKNGHRVIVSGLGKNVPVCDKFVGTMLSLGLNAGFMHTNSAVHGDLGLVQDGDLVIVLTKSGETSESIYLTQQLQKRNAVIWLLSFAKKSILMDMVGENCLLLELSHEGDLWNIAPNNSTTANLIVLQGLAWELAQRMGCTLEQFKQNHPGGHIGELLR